MNRFDDIFSRKAKEAFDSYNADHLADEGWKAYISKHGTIRRRAILIPLWARAASIIILVTAGVLFVNRLNHREASETVGQVTQETGSTQADSAKNKKDSMSAATESDATRAVISSVTSESTATKPQITAAAREVITSTPETTAANNGIALAGQASEAKFGNAGQAREAAGENTGHQTRDAAGPVMAVNAKTDAMPAGMNLPGNPMEIRLADNADARLNLKPKKPLNDHVVLPREKLTTTIMTGLSGMMAGVGDAASTSQGISIGFYVEQQLSRRISVRPGLAMARHNYSLESTPGGSIAFDYTPPELSGMSARTTSYDASIDIVSVEVPVNFVFSLRRRSRSNLFVTTGASTVFYLSQHLSGSFNNTYTKTTVDSNTGDVAYESMTTSVEIESKQEFLNHVDFMGLANFSAGYSLPFGKNTHLLFEPFVQLPVKDLTSLNLRIRYGGLSMKIQF